VIGKVFNDANHNGLQDAGEDGLPGVRVVTARGLAAATDQDGRYHITCATTPNESRGSNFELKLDDRTLPWIPNVPTSCRSGAPHAASPQLTPGRHRVIGIDLSDAVLGRLPRHPRQWCRV
jgi:hypothetical protein